MANGADIQAAAAGAHNHQKKIAAINDFTGFGRCSLAVTLPVLSAMGVQCCALPTSILSNHTGFPSYTFDDYTDRMEAYIGQWKKLGLRFNGIYTGFMGSLRQIDIVAGFLRDFGGEGTIRIIDPVMGDYGRLYDTYTPQLCQGMKTLVAYADILTPNLTEACVLTDTPYKENWRSAEIWEMARLLTEQGPGRVVITGVPQRTFLANFCYQRGGELRVLRTHKIGTSRSGTGDLFASIVAADAVNGVPFDRSVRKAGRFVADCIRRSIELDIPITDGVCFEELLGALIPRRKNNGDLI